MKYQNASPDSIPAWIRYRYDRVVDYTSASLITLKRGEWKYGKIDIKAMLPEGKGVSCAFWLLGVNKDSEPWPLCGEIDMMESVGRLPNRIHSNTGYYPERRFDTS